MTDGIMGMLFWDEQQEIPACYCSRCGGARFWPSLQCIRCGEDADDT